VQRIVLWLMSTLTVLVLLFGYHTSTSSASSQGGLTSLAAPASGNAISGGSTTASSAAASSSAAAASTAAAAPTTAAAPSTSAAATSSAATSGTVTGTVAQTRWGPVQVQLTIANKKITNVSVVQYPNGNGKDQEINSQALPILIQETLDKQSASIDMVSGATVTSDGYLQSLQSALDQAGL
jgi:uncharacterized protein with FMN-binding domain